MAEPSSSTRASSRDVPALVEELLADPERLARMSASMRKLAKPNAADVVADELMALAEARR